MNQTSIDLIEEIKHLIAEIKNSLPTGFDISSISLRAKIPFKALSWREALLYRVSELATTALELYQTRRYVSACILTRALMETTGMLFWMHKKILKVIATKDLQDIDDFLMRGLLGDKEIDSRLDALNALSAVDHVDKEFNNFRQMYDGLSEYAHPNWPGTSGSFGRDDVENMRVEFGFYINDLPWSFLLSPLLKSLIIFRDRYNKLADIFTEFTLLCEKNLEDINDKSQADCS